MLVLRDRDVKEWFTARIDPIGPDFSAATGIVVSVIISQSASRAGQVNIHYYLTVLRYLLSYSVPEVTNRNGHFVNALTKRSRINPPQANRSVAGATGKRARRLRR